MTDLDLLIRDKYDGDAAKVTPEDTARLAAGEPLAYVIGWIPFLDLHLSLGSKPLIPRPETEWWTETLRTHLRKRFSNEQPFRFLDLCAGSGAIGLSVLKDSPTAQVMFGELVPEHCEQIRENIALNSLDSQRALVCVSDLFENLSDTENIPHARFDIIACNPPYIPSTRDLEQSVTNFEPNEALFSGTNGLSLIARIAKEVPAHLNPGAELWLEADIENIKQAAALLERGGASRTVILTDLYDRPRVIVAYYP